MSGERNPMTTEGRVYVAQLTRDLNAREAAGANLMAPGTANWWQAFEALATAGNKVGSPKKCATLFAGALARLQLAQRNDASCYVNWYKKHSRSLHFEVITWEVAKHPITNAGYDGVSVHLYRCSLQRNGHVGMGKSKALAFVSWHALGRLYERGRMSIKHGNLMVAFCGITGLLMMDSAKHKSTELNFAVKDIVCTGILRTTADGYTFFDVLTTLEVNETQRMRAKYEQGAAIHHAVRNYVKADTADPRGYADEIPVLPVMHDDYVSRQLTMEQSR